MVARPVKVAIERFKAALIDAGFPDIKFYLFGSYARGDARPDSDIDICLVSPEFRSRKAKYENKAIVIAYHIDPRIQIILTYPEKFNRDQLSPLFSRIRKEAKAA